MEISSVQVFSSNPLICSAHVYYATDLQKRSSDTEGNSTETGGVGNGSTGALSRPG